MSTLVDLNINSELVSYKHVQDNRPVLQAIKAERESGTRGFNATRTMQKIGIIPALEYHKMCQINPELRDPKRLEKWLMSMEGSAYRIAEDRAGFCPNIIIK